MVQQRFFEKEAGLWILCFFLFLFSFCFFKFSFQFSLISFRRNFKAKDAGCSNERQACEIWLNFYFVLQIYLLIGYLWLNPEDLKFSVLTFRFLPCQTPSESCFSSCVYGVWWKVRNGRISLK